MSVIPSVQPFHAIAYPIDPMLALEIRTLEELKTFFYSLFTWTAAYLAPLVISFNDFLVLFSSPN